MRSFWRGWVLLWLALIASEPAMRGQALATTTVEDTVYRADGTAAGGSAVISWGSFTTASGAEVQAGTTTVTLGSGGSLDVALAPNVGATPMGYYTVVFHLNDGSIVKEFWVVPVTVAGGGPVTLASVRNDVLPTSVAMQAVFELVDQGASSSTPAAVLYDSFAAGAPVTGTPATCAFATVDSLSMVGSIGSVEVSRSGSLWVTSVLSDGTQVTRLEGIAGEGLDFEATYGSSTGTPGKITFFAGRIPAANERVAVSYRTYGRAVARMADAASIAAEAATGVPGTSRWLGAVVRPVARSSADCESAAQAILAFATSRAAAVAGTYKAVNPAADIWPGDVLAITSAGTTTSVLVRSVTVSDGATAPETLGYAIAFANDWATEWEDGLGMRLTETIAADAELPSTPGSGAAGVLSNLADLAITSLTTSTFTLDAGTTAPAGGGFEVRRRDGPFGAATDTADLVLRSPVRGFSIPRATAAERFYVRMYDASTPPLYSRWSSAVFINAPVT